MVLSPSVSADTPSRQVRRDTRLDARYALWDLSGLRRVKACGRFAASNENGVTIRATGTAVDGSRVAGIGGVQSCGSVWACPVCAQKIQAKRQTEVATALAVARHRGWEVLFLTLTMRHERAHRLERLWDHLSTAWGAVTTGAGQRAWKSDKLDFGIQGYLRLVEVTHGENGWHVHAHVLLFCDPERAEVLQQLEAQGRPFFNDREVNELGTRLFLRWRSALDYRGIRPSVRRGVDIKRVRSDEKISEYFAKQIYSRKGEGSTAHDVSGSHGKDAKNGNRTPFGILRDVLNGRTGEVGPRWEEDLELWHTFELASRGRRQLLWARGFRADVLEGLEDLSDEEVVEESPDGDVVAHLPAALWKAVAGRKLIGDVLAAAESDDNGASLALFLSGRLDWLLDHKRIT